MSKTFLICNFFLEKVMKIYLKFVKNFKNF
jgi:hypothetical protein